MEEKEYTGSIGNKGEQGVLGRFNIPEELKAVEVQDLALLDKVQLVELIKQAKRAELLAQEQISQKDRHNRDLIDAINRQSEEVDKFRTQADNVIRGMNEHYDRRVKAIYTIMEATKDLITPPNFDGPKLGE